MSLSLVLSCQVVSPSYVRLPAELLKKDAETYASRRLQEVNIADWSDTRMTLDRRPAHNVSHCSDQYTNVDRSISNRQVLIFELPSVGY